MIMDKNLMSLRYQFSHNWHLEPPRYINTWKHDLCRVGGADVGIKWCWENLKQLLKHVV